MACCDLCGFFAEEEKKVKKHMAVHDTREFNCKTCQQKCTGLQNLNNHEKKHKMIECIHCNKYIKFNGPSIKHFLREEVLEDLKET